MQDYERPSIRDELDILRTQMEKITNQLALIFAQYADIQATLKEVNDEVNDE